MEMTRVPIPLHFIQSAQYVSRLPNVCYVHCSSTTHTELEDPLTSTSVHQCKQQLQ